MRSSKAGLSALFILVFAILGFSSCGGHSITASNNVTSISITPSAATVALNTQFDFTATVTLADSTITTNTSVTWQVNGTNGGNATIGTIVASTTDVNVGIYTAPAIVPTTNNGQVSITAIINESTSSSSTATTTITSNTSTVTVGSGTGLSITPAQVTVPAGAPHQFTAYLNSVVDTAATWTVTSSNGGDIGTIDPTTGLYTAPFAPPPGGLVTITASDPAATATASSTAKIVYSDASLRGPFAFSYVGDNASGHIAEAGSFVSDGQGTIVSGVEDIDSFGTHASTQVSFLNGCAYHVGADGRTNAIIKTPQGTETWQFVLTSNSHALLTRFDTSTTGSGTIDEQNLNDLSALSAISGNYVFRFFGGDTTFAPIGIAGRFFANGAGSIPQSASIVDVNDNATVHTSDTTLSGSYSFDAAFAGTGRGTLTLSSTNIGSRQFAFYIVDNTHLYAVEIDSNGYLAGEIFSAPAGNSFNAGSLAGPNYVFTVGGNSAAGAYAAGGVITSDGAGNISGGVVDNDVAGTATADTSLGSCPYTVDATTGRVDLQICPSGATALEFAAYPTAQGAALLLEIDSSATAGGTAYLQSATPGQLSGNFGMAFAGHGIFQNAPLSYQSNAEGQATLAGTGVSGGNLDISNYGAVYTSDPLATAVAATPSTLTAPDSNGRGTAALITTNPPATYNIVYYMIDANHAVFVGQDKNRIETGIAILQF
ncbi:MAG TPA: hypothetical protein VMH00_06185 [Candidatus Limnocylindrales bacterium]|nr:hypothetical protein [Candidatus Limnocylindrales bacterium]